jgi:hypothetical protein
MSWMERLSLYLYPREGGGRFLRKVITYLNTRRNAPKYRKLIKLFNTLF